MFTLLDTIEPNNEILELAKGMSIEVTKGTINCIKNTNIKTVLPLLYQITYNNEKLCIYEYKGEFKGNKKYFIPTLNNTFNLKEIKQILKGLN